MHENITKNQRASYSLTNDLGRSTSRMAFLYLTFCSIFWYSSIVNKDCAVHNVVEILQHHIWRSPLSFGNTFLVSSSNPYGTNILSLDLSWDLFQYSYHVLVTNLLNRINRCICIYLYIERPAVLHATMNFCENIICFKVGQTSILTIFCHDWNSYSSLECYSLDWLSFPIRKKTMINFL